VALWNRLSTTRWWPPRIVLGLRCSSSPTTDNPWEKHVYRDWKHRVTNICLTAVQEVMQSGEKGTSSHLMLFTPQDKETAANANSYVPNGNKRNVEGLLMYHPLLVNDPWQPPDNLDARIDDLIAETKTLLVQWAHNPWDQYDANKARAQIAEIKKECDSSIPHPNISIYFECVSRVVEAPDTKGRKELPLHQG
jgi:hypothetical protein